MVLPWFYHGFTNTRIKYHPVTVLWHEFFWEEAEEDGDGRLVDQIIKSLPAASWSPFAKKCFCSFNHDGPSPNDQQTIMELDEIYMRFTWDSHEIYMRFTWDLHEICMRFTWDLHEIYMRFTLDLPVAWCFLSSYNLTFLGGYRIASKIHLWEPGEVERIDETRQEWDQLVNQDD